MCPGEYGTCPAAVAKVACSQHWRNHSRYPAGLVSKPSLCLNRSGPASKEPRAATISSGYDSRAALPKLPSELGRRSLVQRSVWSHLVVVDAVRVDSAARFLNRTPPVHV